MRFIIHEQAYEKPIVAGQLRYERDGRPTGAVESWRLTAAVAGYRILRVDLDAREATSGHSYLYHLVLGESGRPERLNYRFWGAGLQVAGIVLLEETAVIASRTVNGQRFETELVMPAGYGFWFPSVLGLGLLATPALPGVAQVTAVSLCPDFGAPATALKAFVARVDLAWHDVEPLLVNRETLPVRPLALRWADQERVLWLNEAGWPLKMRREDGLTALSTRYVRYQT